MGRIIEAMLKIKTPALPRTVIDGWPRFGICKWLGF
jgi:hypothetical protein